MKNLSLYLAIVLSFMAMNSVAQFYGILTDSRDNKTYRTVQIGSQTWMADNLAFRGGFGCWVMDWNENMVKPYGYLYNFEAAKTSCPQGWHLPTDAEWTTLVNYLGGETVAGGKLKETGTVHWQSPNKGATNETSFTALPGGNYLYMEGKFPGKDGGYYWSSSEYDGGTALYRYMLSYTSYVHRASYLKTTGLSLRCVAN